MSRIRLNDDIIERVENYLNNNSNNFNNFDKLYDEYPREELWELTAYLIDECDVTIEEILDNLTFVPDLFDAYDDNIKSITISDNVESIGFASFKGCSNLSSAKLPQNLKSIDVDAFLNCYSLESIVVSSNTEISEYAFDEDCEIIRR